MRTVSTAATSRVMGVIVSLPTAPTLLLPHPILPPPHTQVVAVARLDAAATTRR